MSTEYETPSEVDLSDASYWQDEIQAAKDRAEDWYKSAEKAIERYEDDAAREFGRLNILWANCEVQKAALGDDFGKPEVTRVNAPNDHRARLVRHISLVLEKTIVGAVADTQDNRAIRRAVLDVLLPGRGQVWLELNPQKDEAGNVTWIEAPLVRLGYKDYLEGAAEDWRDTPWVARRHLFTKDDLKRVAKKHADEVSLGYEVEHGESCKDKEQFKRAVVWELWDKASKSRIYVAEGYDTSLLITPDPYRLKGFFPCPQPMLANENPEHAGLPLTDYSRYEDQAVEIDRLSARIFVLTETLRRRGIYDAAVPALADLAEAPDNYLVACQNWAELMSKGGLPAAVQWEDLQPTIAVLAQLHQQRAELIQLTYELTGISDLARGQTDPNETLGAQKLKQSYGSGRFADRQKEARRFAADAYRLKGELIAEHFSREQIVEMSGIELPLAIEVQQAQQAVSQMQQASQMAQQTGQQPPFNPDAMQQAQHVAQSVPWEAVADVLRSDRRRSYTVDVATDQTQFKDEEADKASRIEFMQTALNTLTQLTQMLPANPALGPFVQEMTMFVTRAFKAGRVVEESLEDAIKQMIEKAKQLAAQPQQPPADPVAMAQAQLVQVQTQREGAKIQLDAQKAQVELQIAKINLQLKQMELQIKQQEVQAKAVGHQLDLQAKVERASNGINGSAPQAL